MCVLRKNRRPMSRFSEMLQYDRQSTALREASQPSDRRTKPFRLPKEAGDGADYARGRASKDRRAFSEGVGLTSEDPSLI